MLISKQCARHKLHVSLFKRASCAPPPIQIPDGADAEGSVYRDASDAFESLQLSPTQLGSQAGASEAQVLPAAEDSQRSGSPAGVHKF